MKLTKITKERPRLQNKESLAIMAPKLAENSK